MQKHPRASKTDLLLHLIDGRVCKISVSLYRPDLGKRNSAVHLASEIFSVSSMKVTSNKETLNYCLCLCRKVI